MIKIIRLIINFVMAVFLLSNTNALASFAGGDGTSGNPYQIADVNQLQEMQNYLSSSFILVNDIDASATYSWNSGAGFAPIGDSSTKFTGILDGQGYKITNLYINRPEEYYLGLFGYIDAGAEIADVGVTVSITGNRFVGGLVGSANTGSTITSCFSSGALNADSWIGGLIGWHYGSATSCYSTASVNGSSYIGGLLGGSSGSVTSCYSTGSVDGSSNVGGLIGYKPSGTVTSCFWNTETSGRTSSSGGTGKTTAEMMQQATYSGWDFTSTWGIAEDSSYPYLQSTGNRHIAIYVLPFSGLTTYEYGSTTEFKVCLGSKPASNVSIALASDDTTEGDVSVSSLTFTNSDWYIPQTVAVTGIDDGIVDGDQTYSIVLSPAGSSDTEYNGIDPEDVSLVNNDLVLISNINELQDINLDLAGYYALTNDIDASATCSWDNGAGFEPIGDSSTRFTGVFDGRGYEITGLYVNRPEENYVGLFGFIDAGAEIVDVGVMVVITGDDYVGGLVGYNYTGGTVMSCFSSGIINGNNRAGGLIGQNYGSAAAANCYSTASVSGSSYTGGLIGWNSGSVTSCCSTGDVDGDSNVGGLVGYNSGGTITSCFWNTETSGQASSAGGTGKTTAEMMQQVTYSGWDFTSTWSVVEDSSYPFLQTTGNSHIAIYVLPFSGLTTYEYGTSAQFKVCLGSKPASDVSIAVASADTTEGEVSVTGLTFTDSDWNTPQTVTVTGIDDGIVDGDQAYSIILSPAVSSDTNYNGLDPDDVSLINYDPVPISNINELQNMNLDLAGYYALTNDIDASATFSWNSGAGFLPIGNYSTEFTGILEGRGYQITNLYINRPGENTLGLFGNAGAGSEIFDVGLNGNVTGHTNVGGLVGKANTGSIIRHCFSSGTVNGYSCVGGLIGQHYGSATNCYSTASVVSESSDTGGLIGSNWRGSVTSCYSTGSVDGTSSVGGLVGYSYDGTITACFWNTETSGQASSAGGGAGKTSAEMMQQATYSDWDFTSIWSIAEGCSYPFLQSTGNRHITIYALPVSTLATYEYGSSAQFEVCLGSKPASDVSIAVSSADTTEGDVSVANLTFTDSDWNTPQTVTVTGMDDWIVDGEQIYSIILSPAVSSDTDYNGLDPEDVSLISYDPVPISNINELQDINLDLAGYYALTDDIDASTTASWNSGAGFDPMGEFTGILDGEGHLITGLYINRPEENYVGLFGSTGSEAIIVDLGVCGDITGNSVVGILVGDNSGSITNSYSNARTNGTYNVGGLAGLNEGGIITKSHSTGSVKGYQNQIGGLVGCQKGLLVGDDKTTISNCYSTASVAGSVEVGGLVGRSERGFVSCSYSTGHVNGDADVGGLAGYCSGTVTNSFWNTETSGQVTSDGGTGKTTEEMLHQGAFTGWDFTETWSIIEGRSYPFLQSLGNSHIAISVFPVFGLKTYEYGSTAEFEVSLGSKPTSEVSIAFNSSDTTEGVVSVVSLTFTDSDWYIPQKITVTGINDGIVDGDQDYSLIISPAISSDTEYSGLDPADVQLINYDPVLISNVNELQNMNLDLSGYYQLTGDIDASVTVSWNSGAGFDPIGDNTSPFTGVFNGQGYNISGLYINRATEDYVGLFGYTSYQGEILNTGVDGDITGEYCVGSFAGLNRATIENCYSTCSVNGAGYDTGGLVGCNKYRIISCYNIGNVSGTFCVGGMVGSNDSGSIISSYNTGSVNGVSDYVGGLIGQCSGSGFVANSYSTGSVNGYTSVGGLIGQRLTSVYSTTINSSYWDTETSGQAYSSGGTGKTTAEMKQQGTFTGWNFTDTWRMDENISYPFLQSLGDSYIRIIVSPASGLKTYEYGGSAAFDVWLGSKPANDVNITVSSSDTTEGDVSVATLTFTDSDWAIPQTVTVTGVEDGIVDGDQVYSITLSPAVSSDPDYNGIDPDDVFLTNYDPVLINNINEFQNINLNLSGYYKLADDIDASPTVSWNSGAGFDPVSSFTGILDGDGHKITGLYINRPGESYVGLFGYLGDDAEIVNVGVDGNVIGASYVGGLAGYSLGRAIGSYSTGSVTGASYVGGLVGYSRDAVSTCYSTASVNGTSYTGGLLGNNSGTVTSTYSTGSVSGSYIYTGGLIGRNSSGTVNDSYSTGSVTGASYVGGFLGCSENGIITNSYSTGSVNGSSNVGGLVGYGYNTTITDSFWNTETSGRTTSSGGTGKTAEEMLHQATFTGWDFTETWNIIEGRGYPFLQSLGNSHIAIFVSPVSGLKTYEYGSTAEFEVRLGSKPTSDVSIAVISSDTTEGDVSVATLILNDSNWFGQTVTVTGVDDGIVDGDQSYSIILSPAVSSDPDYNGIDPNDVFLINYDPVQISNINDLQDLSLDLSGYYKLVGDIDASATASWNSGAGFDPVSGFTGILDGHGYKISGIYINRPGENYVGLFGSTDSSAVIIGLVIDGDITGNAYVGGLVGNNGGTVINSFSMVDIMASSYAGGLVGYNDGGTISSCYSTGGVCGNAYVGGLVGNNYYYAGPITSCYSTGYVSGSTYVGGLVGRGDYTKVTFSYWDKETSGQTFSSGGTGKTTAEMFQQITFSGWDFINTWSIDENTGYPFLQALGDTPANIYVSRIAGLSTYEYGGSAEIKVRLGSKPASDVSIAVISSDTTEGDVSVATLILNDSNWFGQTVTVTGVDDYIVDGDQVYSIIFSPAVSLDADYDSIKPDDVSLVNNDPVPVYDINDLQDMDLDLTGYYALYADIDAGDTINWNSGAGFDPIGAQSQAFSGVFDGHGYKITSLYVNRPGEDYMGLFAVTGPDSTVVDVDLEADVIGEDYVGGIVGKNMGTVFDCICNGKVRGISQVGALVGQNYGLLSYCHSIGKVKGNNQVGGLVGVNTNAVTYCYSTANAAGEVAVGGLVGYTYYDFTSPYSNNTISDCYSTGNVEGDQNVGGLVGYADYYIVSDSFWDTETSGLATSAGGTGKTTAEMQQQATFSGWDFTDVWNIYENHSYPFFVWDPDVDRDGISNTDETDVYGTLPYLADSDSDGVDDGDELIYWGADWNTDYDGDAATYANNLLDPDADNDGIMDGEEINNGSDPGDADSPSNPYPDLIDWNNNLVADFGDNGLWYYDGSVWNWMTNTGNVDQMVVWDGKLVVDFGIGLYYYDGTWHWMTNRGAPSTMITWNNGTSEVLVVDFGGGRRMYTYDGTWNWFNNKDDVAGMIVWNDTLVVDFGSGQGVYNNDGSWHWLTNRDDISLMLSWDNGVSETLVTDFGGGRGMYTYDGTWHWLTNKDDVNAMAVWNNKLVVDFGGGRKMYTYDGTWAWLNNKDDVTRMVSWNDGFNDLLAVDFGSSRGMYNYDGFWTWMSNKDDAPEMIAWDNGLAVDFGSGEGVYQYNGAWTLLKGWSTAD